MKSDTLKRSVTCLKPFVYGRFRRKVTLLRFFMILFESNKIFKTIFQELFGCAA